MAIDLRQDAIIKALVAARRARDAEFRLVLSNSDLAAVFSQLMDHPYLLPLAELVENECTTLAGARILLENLLAREHEATLVDPVLGEMRVETLMPTNVSRSELKELLKELSTPFDLLPIESAILG